MRQQAALSTLSWGLGMGSFLSFLLAFRNLLTLLFTVFGDRCFRNRFLKINFSFLFAYVGTVPCKQRLNHAEELFFFPFVTVFLVSLLLSSGKTHHTKLINLNIF